MKSFAVFADAIAKMGPSAVFLVAFVAFSYVYFHVDPARSGAAVLSWTMPFFMSLSGLFFFTKLIFDWPKMRLVDGK